MKQWQSTMSNCFKRLIYPPAPQKPSDNDCCGNGCNPCVFDIYELDLKKWKQNRENIDNGVSSNSTSTLSEHDFLQFEITELKSHANNIKLFKFKIPENNQLPIHCGQHLVARYVSFFGFRASLVIVNSSEIQ